MWAHLDSCGLKVILGLLASSISLCFLIEAGARKLRSFFCPHGELLAMAEKDVRTFPVQSLALFASLGVPAQELHETGWARSHCMCR